MIINVFVSFLLRQDSYYIKIVLIKYSTCLYQDVSIVVTAVLTKKIPYNKVRL